MQTAHQNEAMYKIDDDIYNTFAITRFKLHKNYTLHLPILFRKKGRRLFCHNSGCQYDDVYDAE